jgi:hypothetical protein
MTDAGPQAGYAPVNGLEMYYEVHGTGEPLILLHGGVGAIEMFGEVLPLLAEGRQVIDCSTNCRSISPPDSSAVESDYSAASTMSTSNWKTRGSSTPQGHAPQVSRRKGGLT